MSDLGLYIHVPFCHRICNYCDFYVTTARKHFSRFAEGIERELGRVASSLGDRPAVTSIYAGGGTPSFLPLPDWHQVFAAIRSNFHIDDVQERTLEVNPPDVTADSVRRWLDMGFNRLSMGVQSFQDDELRFLTRNHDAKQAVHALKIARSGGFSNINVDLIFGLPGQSREMWLRSINRALELDPEHLSVYNLTVEERTHLHKMVTRKQVELPDDDMQLALFLTASETLTRSGYDHYEISNYAKPGQNSRHNSAYWNGQPYLGVGPSAHSFDGSSRWWNVRSVTAYMDRLEAGKLPVEGRETLTREQKMIEAILLSLRQQQGLDIRLFESQFGVRFDSTFAVGLETTRDFHSIDNHHLKLTREGMFLYNAVCRSLTNCIPS